MYRESTLPDLESPWGHLALRVLFEDWFRLKGRVRRQRLTGSESLQLERVENALKELGIDAATLRRLSERQTSETDRPQTRETTPGTGAGLPSAAQPFV